jgi:hypothetical protein
MLICKVCYREKLQTYTALGDAIGIAQMSMHMADEHGISEYQEDAVRENYCRKCDLARHECPGCGAELTHLMDITQGCCDDCCGNTSLRSEWMRWKD